MGDNAPGPDINKIKNFGNQPFAAFTELADPFHIDPAGRQLHTWAAGVADPSQDPDQSFAAQIKKPGAGHDSIDKVPMPSAEAGANAGLQDTLSRENRIRSASTILTSGAGLLDEPNTYSASRSLIGN